MPSKCLHSSITCLWPQLLFAMCSTILLSVAVLLWIMLQLRRLRRLWLRELLLRMLQEALKHSF
ncbi:unnamed protein product [Enterobius vermicularis]|uniref:GP41 domain-containing protein n=1 Tax=Enterobius vermicularis TaxID=51028 RepID=A0A0N4UTS6_ENTVE|nr:unnamed protein product [Enterobius vermicularis]